MDPLPWIEHFKKTAGATTMLSTRPLPVVIEKRRLTDVNGSKVNESLPLTIVSPVGQSNEMAEADLRMENDKRSAEPPRASVVKTNTASAQVSRKRKQRPSASTSTGTGKATVGDKKNKKKKLTKTKDIFSQHGLG
jgi:hypothetical protein